MPDPVIIVDYDPAWPVHFEMLHAVVASALGDLALTVEHVGSTAVPGLAAKPIIDMDVVIPSRSDVPTAVDRLSRLGYKHRGDLGIAGREAFSHPPGLPPHHLDVCARDSEELMHHILFRDYLRAHPDEARAYAQLKRRAASVFREDRDAYTEAKSVFVEELLQLALDDAGGFSGSTAEGSHDRNDGADRGH
jgi:GrpB-like predicted nucleotidyltransferase (UPF0157 family)